MDVSWKYLNFFLEDDERLEDIGRRYAKGDETMLTGHIKKELITVRLCFRHKSSGSWGLTWRLRGGLHVLMVQSSLGPTMLTMNLCQRSAGGHVKMQHITNGVAQSMALCTLMR